MNRSRVTSIALLLSMFGLAGACSSEAARDTGAADAGGTSTKTDSGTKKDSGGTITEEDDAGTTEEEDAGAVKKDSGTTKDSSTANEGGGGSDSGNVIVVVDSGPDDAAITDSGGAVTDADAALVCAPGSVASFTPSWKLPKATHVSACTTTQVDTIVDCFFDEYPNATTCNTVLTTATNTACKTCLFSDEADATHGALVGSHSSEIFSLNVGGCIARFTNDVTANGCGAKVQAASQCGDAACLATCADPNDYLTCLDDAKTTSCTTYETAANCADTILAGDASVSTCAYEGYGFVSNAKWYGRLFCTP